MRKCDVCGEDLMGGDRDDRYCINPRCALGRIQMQPNQSKPQMLDEAEARKWLAWSEEKWAADDPAHNLANSRGIRAVEAIINGVKREG